jgi:hypothetical protein
LLRLLLWSGLSVLGATAVATMTAARRVRSPLLQHFASQMAAWGVVVGVIAGIGLRTLELRDVSGATRLERLAWMNIGLDVGYVAVGLVLAVCAWTIARRMAPIGAGVAIVVQGMALLLIDLQFAAAIAR